MTAEVRIGLIGTGFGRRVMMPVFAALESAHVVAVCSGHRENAVATSEEFSITGVYTDYEEMIEKENLDLVLITAPPHLHLPISQSALSKNINVLCEKPTALDAIEAEKMYKAAQQSDKLCLIDHELRFLPTFRKMKELIAEGYVGPLGNIRFAINWGYPMSYGRHWNWWFDADKGGGLLGALGSHQVDLIRFLLGEFKAIKGEINISEKFRALADSEEQREVTADDYAVIMAELECGAIGSIMLDSRARAIGDGHFWQIAVHGDKGSLIWDDRRILTGIPHEGDPMDFTQAVEVDGIMGLPDQVFPSGFAHFAPEILNAIQTDQMEIPNAPTFYDGLRVQLVLDAVRKSHQNGNWVNCSIG